MAWVSLNVFSERASDAIGWTSWPTMMIDRRPSWMKVCAIHATIRMSPGFVRNLGTSLFVRTPAWMRIAGRLVRAIRQKIYAIAIDPTACVMMTASLALKPSTSPIACLISDGLKRTAFVRWCRVLTAFGGFDATGPAVVVPDGVACGVIGVALRAVGLKRVPVVPRLWRWARRLDRDVQVALRRRGQYVPGLGGGPSPSPDASAPGSFLGGECVTLAGTSESSGVLATRHGHGHLLTGLNHPALADD